MHLPFNAFTLHNLIGFVVTAALSVTFFLVYVSMGRRLLDLLSAAFVGCASLMCLVSFLTDNLVPAGMSSLGWDQGPTAAELAWTTLRIHRFGWVFATLLLPLQLHFVLVYCQRTGSVRRHIAWAYGLALVATACIWSPAWFAVRTEPLAPTSSWSVAIPWMPVAGWPATPYTLAWFLMELTFIRLLWRSRNASGPGFDETHRQWGYVFVAFVAQVVIGILDPVSVIVGYNGISFIPIGSTVMGVLLAAALIRSRVQAFRTRLQLEREKAALLQSVALPLLFLDGTRRVRWANPSARAVPWVTGELTGRGAEAWIRRGSTEWQCLDQALESGQPTQCEVRRTDGSIWVTQISPIREDDGRVLGAVLVSTDVSRIRWAEQTQQELSRRLIEARDTERRRLASDLHDTLGQELVALKLSLELRQNGYGSGTPEHRYLAAAADTSLRILQQVRQVCYDLYPPSLDAFGLPSAIQGIAVPGRPGLIRTEVTAQVAERRFPADIELALFRVTQEAVSNAVRHSGATRITVRLDADAENLLLTVVDNGRGFDAERSGGSTGLGMSSMRNRVEGVGGVFTVRSAPGQTCIGAAVPLRDNGTAMPADTDGPAAAPAT